jgi:hypothetical protein
MHASWDSGVSGPSKIEHSRRSRSRARDHFNDQLREITWPVTKILGSGVLRPVMSGVHRDHHQGTSEMTYGSMTYGVG